MTVADAVAALTRAVNGHVEGEVWVSVAAVRCTLDELARLENCRRTNKPLHADAGYCHAIDVLRKALAVATAQSTRHDQR